MPGKRGCFNHFLIIRIEAVLIARSTMSLSLFYQIVGRGMHTTKPNA
jgi:superfamily II DNA or RNA helicase